MPVVSGLLAVDAPGGTIGPDTILPGSAQLLPALFEGLGGRVDALGGAAVAVTAPAPNSTAPKPAVNPAPVAKPSAATALRMADTLDGGADDAPPW